MRKCLILVAGGKGTRMGALLPKQFLDLAGKPIILWTLQKFLNVDPAIKIILALPQEWVNHWQDLYHKYTLEFPVQLSKAGETRFHTVKNALPLAQDDELIAVHDAVRPLVSEDTIRNCFNLADDKGSAVPTIELQESLREITTRGNKTVNRTNFRIVQTPQIFKGSILKKAYQSEFIPAFTDDASVVEYSNFPIYLCEGNRENIKITTPFDLSVASSLLSL